MDADCYEYAPEWGNVKPGTPIRVGFEEFARDGYFVRVEASDPDSLYGGSRFLVYTDEPGGPERKAGLTYYHGEEEKPRPARAVPA